MTLPEAMLWVRLRIRRPDTPVIRRQHAIGSFVLDFYCPAVKLCIEVDGWGHNMGDHPQRDERRDAWLSGQGVETLRILATEVLRDADAAADMIVNTIEGRRGGGW